MIFNGWNTKWKYFFLSFKSPIFGVCIRFKQKSHCPESHNSFDRSMFSTDMYRAIISSTCHCFFLPSLLFQQNRCQNYPFFFFFIFSILATLLPQLQSFFFSFLSPISAKPLLELSFFFYLLCFGNTFDAITTFFFFFFSFLLFQQNHLELPFFFYLLLFWQHHCHNYNFFFLLSPISANPLLSSPILVTPLPQLQFFFFLSCLLFWQHHCHFYFFSLIHFRSRAIYFQSWGKKWAAISSIFGHGQSFFGHRKGKNWVAIVALRMPNLFFSLLSPL